MSRKFLFVLFIASPFVSHAQLAKSRELLFPDTLAPCQLLFKSQLSLDGNYLFFEDRCDGADKWDIYIQKLDTALNPLLSTRISVQPGPGNTFYGVDALELPDSSFVVLYYFYSNYTLRFVHLNKYGQYVSDFTYESASSFYPTQLNNIGMDTLIVSGQTTTSSGYLMFDPSGNLIQSNLIAFNGTGTTPGKTLIGQDISIVQMHAAQNTSDRSPTICKFDNNGTLEWAYLLKDTNQIYEINDAIELSNGNYLFCGFRRIFATGIGEGFLICVSPDGNQLWSKTCSPATLTFAKLTETGNDSVLVAAYGIFPRKGINILVDFSGNLIGSYGYDATGSVARYSSFIDSEKNIISLSSFDAIVPYRISKAYPFANHNCYDFHYTPVFSDIIFDIDSSYTLSASAPFTQGVNTVALLFDYSLPVIWDSCFVTGLSPEVNNEERLIIYPNPTHDFVTIAIPEMSTTFQYTISNALGGLVAEGNLTGQESKLDLSELDSGIYLINISGDNFSVHEKIIRY